MHRISGRINPWAAFGTAFGPAFGPAFARRLLRLAATLYTAALAACVAAPETQGPPIWEIGEGAERMWLFGSIHALPPGARWITPALVSRFRRAERLVMETDPRAAAQQNFNRMLEDAARLPEGRRLDAFYDAGQARRVLNAVNEWGLSERVARRTAPWRTHYLLASLEPEKAGGAQSRYGSDLRLYRDAILLGKEIVPLETVRQQAQAVARGFAPYTIEQQAAFLLFYVDHERPAAATRYGELLDHWLRGDTDALAAELAASHAEDEPLYVATTAERSARWLPQIEALIGDKKDDFVVVGLAHIVGPAGLIALLEQRGYSVRRVQ